MKEVELENIADGVAKELFTNELMKVAGNIADQNCSSKTKRKIVLTFVFAPDEQREEMKITVSATSKLAPVRDYSKTAWLGKRNGKATVFAQDERQLEMTDAGVATLAPKVAHA